MGLLGRLFSGNPQSDVDKAVAAVTRGVNDLLKRETGFSNDEREIFWNTHLGKIAPYSETMTNAISSVDVSQLSLAEKIEWKCMSNYLSEARRIGGIFPAMDFRLIGDFDYDRARSNPDAIRGLVISNIIGYLLQYRGQTDSTIVQWEAYVGVLRNLGLAPALSPA